MHYKSLIYNIFYIKYYKISSIINKIWLIINKISNILNFNKIWDGLYINMQYIMGIINKS